MPPRPIAFDDDWLAGELREIREHLQRLDDHEHTSSTRNRPAPVSGGANPATFHIYGSPAYSLSGGSSVLAPFDLRHVNTLDVGWDSGTPEEFWLLEMGLYLFVATVTAQLDSPGTFDASIEISVGNADDQPNRSSSPIVRSRNSTTVGGASTSVVSRESPFSGIYLRVQNNTGGATFTVQRVHLTVVKLADADDLFVDS